MDIVLNSRHCELTEKFREHVREKVARFEKQEHRVVRVEVEVEKQRNPRQADRAVRVQLTGFSKGPVIRAEASAEDKLAALDLAMDRMAAQMRRAADRRRVHRGRRTPVSVGRALADVQPSPDGNAEPVPASAPPATRVVPTTVMADGPLVLRENSRPASPMTLDHALYQL